MAVNARANRGGVRAGQGCQVLAGRCQVDMQDIVGARRRLSLVCGLRGSVSRMREHAPERCDIVLQCDMLLSLPGEKPLCGRKEPLEPYGRVLEGVRTSMHPSNGATDSGEHLVERAPLLGNSRTRHVIASSKGIVTHGPPSVPRGAPPRVAPGGSYPTPSCGACPAPARAALQTSWLP